MAKTSVVERNKRKQRTVAKYADLRAKLKKEGNYEALQQLPRDSSATRLRNRCSLTGRGRGVYSKFGVCRHMVRKLAHEGKLPGVKKASW